MSPRASLRWHSAAVYDRVSTRSGTVQVWVRVGRVVGGVSRRLSADFFFLAADFRGDGVEGLGEVVDAVGQPGEGEQFAVPGAVAVDDRAEVAAAV